MPPALVINPQPETDFVRYAKAHFDEQDKRAYEESIIDRTGLETVTPPILSAVKTRMKAQNPILQQTLFKLIPSAPTPPSIESTFTRNIKDGKLSVDQRAIERKIGEMNVTPVNTPTSPNQRPTESDPIVDLFCQAVAPGNVRSRLDAKMKSKKKAFNPNKLN